MFKQIKKTSLTKQSAHPSITLYVIERILCHFNIIFSFHVKYIET